MTLRPTGSKGDLDLERKFRGGVRENPDEFQKRVLNAPKPSYPALAQRAGLQGIVKLQVRVMKDGHVEVQKLLEGDPTLADAAITACKAVAGKATLDEWRACRGDFDRDVQFSAALSGSHCQRTNFVRVLGFLSVKHLRRGLERYDSSCFPRDCSARFGPDRGFFAVPATPSPKRSINPIRCSPAVLLSCKT